MAAILNPTADPSEVLSPRTDHVVYRGGTLFGTRESALPARQTTFVEYEVFGGRIPKIVHRLPPVKVLKYDKMHNCIRYPNGNLAPALNTLEGVGENPISITETQLVAALQEDREATMNELRSLSRNDSRGDWTMHVRINGTAPKRFVSSKRRLASTKRNKSPKKSLEERTIDYRQKNRHRAELGVCLSPTAEELSDLSPCAPDPVEIGALIRPGDEKDVTRTYYPDQEMIDWLLRNGMPASAALSFGSSDLIGIADGEHLIVSRTKDELGLVISAVKGSPDRRCKRTSTHSHDPYDDEADQDTGTYVQPGFMFGRENRYLAYSPVGQDPEHPYLQPAEARRTHKEILSRTIGLAVIASRKWSSNIKQAVAWFMYCGRTAEEAGASTRPPTKIDTIYQYKARVHEIAKTFRPAPRVCLPPIWRPLRQYVTGSVPHNSIPALFPGSHAMTEVSEYLKLLSLKDSKNCERS